MLIYKVLDSKNNFYLYGISESDDMDLLADIFEHTCSVEEEKPIYKYFHQFFENIEISAPQDVTIDNYFELIKKHGPFYTKCLADEKCMNTSNKYQELIVEKKKRQSKPKAEPKKEPKPKKTPKPKAPKMLLLKLMKKVLN